MYLVVPLTCGFRCQGVKAIHKVALRYPIDDTKQVFDTLVNIIGESVESGMLYKVLNREVSRLSPNYQGGIGTQQMLDVIYASFLPEGSKFTMRQCCNPQTMLIGSYRVAAGS